MEKYVRKRPVCGEEVCHKSKRSLVQCAGRPCGSCASKARIKQHGNNAGFLRYCQKGCNVGKDNPFYGKKHSEETKEKFKSRDLSYRKEDWYREMMSVVTSGVGNPMYGISCYDVWLRKYGKEKADVLMRELKEKRRQQCTGAGNPMYGRPSPQGSGNGWSGWYNGVFFRSLRELSYIVGLDKQHVAWKAAESIKIKYTNWDGKEKIYRPDFLVEGKIVEIKPTRLQSSKVVQLKEQAAKVYCAERGLLYEIIDPLILSGDEIKFLRQSGIVKFTDRYEKMYLEKYSD